MKGWNADTTKVKNFGELPNEAQSLIKMIEKFSKKEVAFVSTSSSLDEGMVRVRGP